jgi:hypothetical protein
MNPAPRLLVIRAWHAATPENLEKWQLIDKLPFEVFDYDAKFSPDFDRSKAGENSVLLVGNISIWIKEGAIEGMEFSGKISYPFEGAVTREDYPEVFAP